MVKEMSSFKEKKIELNNNFSLIDKLNIIADHFQDNYQLEMYFCEIIGKRWSFIAGRSDSYLPQKKIKLYKNLGMVVDDNKLSEELVRDLTDVVKSSLEETMDEFSS
jgi:hypothetical protein